MNVCVRALVFGSVQGVGFRLFCKKKARDHGIQGYALNLSDGRVEVLMYGDELAVNQMIEALSEGPTFANVLGVDLEDGEIPKTLGFMTG